MSTPTLYNIPASSPFTPSLVRGLLAQYQAHPEQLSQLLILLPTRRSCRVLRDEFLKQTKGKALLLPRMSPFSDIDEEELFISARGNNVTKIPPAMSALQRQILLAQTISKLPAFSQTPDQDVKLAKILGQLMDQIYTENLNFSALPTLVDAKEFEEHWKITVHFLSILSEVWPTILKQYGMIDAADRRNRLINALRTHWETRPPTFPIIAAGSTGSIPATTQLLKTISLLESGCVILPALDQKMKEDLWESVEDGHPQATLKHLLNELDVKRQDIKRWSGCTSLSKTQESKEQFISNLMLPANKTDEWQKISLSPEKQDQLKESLNNITLYECDNPNEEALLIATLLRETLENKEKTAALITPDRNLARRVAMTCKRWGIDIDDSAGCALSETPLGSYLRLCAHACLHQLAPVSFLALLKHDLCRGDNFPNFRQNVRFLEQALLRGLPPTSGFEGLRQRLKQEQDRQTLRGKELKHKTEILSFIDHLEKIFTPFLSKMSEQTLTFSDLLKAHIHLAETLANFETDKGENTLWSGEAGEAAAIFLSELQEQSTKIPSLSPQSYVDIFEQLLSTITVRPRFGMHPRLTILGQLEARLIQADRVILSGLNEGSWPPDPGHDPWMSRPMRRDFGLPSPERSIGLSAHDFVQGLSAQEVFITRSRRMEGTPTVPARWIERLKTLLKTLEINPNILTQRLHLHYVTALNKTDPLPPITRPAPTPPVTARPRTLSVTKIETWLKDPYAIYARSILKLKKLEPLEKIPEAAEKGAFLHDVLEQFVTTYPKHLPDDAEEQFISLSKKMLEELYDDSAQLSFWLPRLIRLGGWFIEHERTWRDNTTVQKLEVTGSLTLTPENDALSAPFSLTARADRIDKEPTGGAIIIDYKSGGTFPLKGIVTGKIPQLPLEALILERGGFSLSTNNVTALSYWVLTGGREEGKIITLNKPEEVKTALSNAEEGLLTLIQVFDDPKTPYYSIPCLDNAPRFNDYEHLARVKEWTALDEQKGEVA